MERYCITVSPCPDIIWGNCVLQKIFGVNDVPRVPLDCTTVPPVCEELNDDDDDNDDDDLHF